MFGKKAAPEPFVIDASSVAECVGAFLVQALVVQVIAPVYWNNRVHIEGRSHAILRAGPALECCHLRV
jgi:hypothetical protein